MSEKINPLSKLDIPEPPEGLFWELREDAWLGTEIHLCRKKKFFKRRYGSYSIDSRIPIEFLNHEMSFKQSLENSARRLLRAYNTSIARRKEVKDLLDTKIYLDDLIAVGHDERPV
jgi:hypothetical protein